MKKKWLFVFGLLLIIIVLSLSKHKSSSNSESPIVDDGEVIYEDTLVVDKTSNLFSILGNKTSNLCAVSFGLVFNIINKMLEFIFGI